jgi:hypothetical protein
MSSPKIAPLPHKPIEDVNRLLTDWWGSIHLATANPRIDPRDFPGGMRIFWEKYASTVRQFIETNSLHSVDEVVAKLKAITEQQPMMEFLLKWNNPRGGFPGCHLHYDGKVYPLAETQWKAFSRSALTNLKQRLEKPGSVTFEQFAAISNAIDGVIA